MTLITLLFGLSTAQAVPVKITQQGRLLDNTGAAVTGVHLLHLRLFDDQSGGNLVWDESQQILFNNGYYAVILGADIASNPLAAAAMDPVLQRRAFEAGLSQALRGIQRPPE